MLLELRKKIANIICPEIETERRSFERFANTDQLTGLANRRAFDLATATAASDPQTVFILFDGNNFGKVNKAAGHATGDEVIKKAAAAIRSAAMKFNLDERCFRVGGDEFAVIAPVKFAQSIRWYAENLFGSFDVSGVAVSLTGEIGETLEKADSKLQARKAERKQK